MTWITDTSPQGLKKWIGGADGYRYEIWRKFSHTYVLEQYANGKLVRATHHSTLTAAKDYAADPMRSGVA